MSNSIYSTSYDHDVKKVMLFVKDEILCEDFEGAKPVKEERLRELFINGMLLIGYIPDDGKIHYGIPTHYTYDTRYGYGIVSFDHNGNTIKWYSVEYLDEPPR